MNTFCFILLPSDDKYVRKERRTDYDEYSCPVSRAIQRQLSEEMEEGFTVAVNSPTHKVTDRGHDIDIFDNEGTHVRKFRHNLASALYVEYFDRSLMADDDIIMHAAITGQPPQYTIKVPEIELNAPIAFCLEEVPV